MEGLFDIVDGAEVKRFDLLHLAVPGREDEDGALVEGGGALQRLLAVHVGKAEIEDDRLGGAVGDNRQSSGRGIGAHGLVAGGLQGGPEEPVDLGIVVDDQDAGFVSGHAVATAAGSASGALVAFGRLIRIRVPRPWCRGLAAAIRPPMASMKPRAMERPRPAPLLRSFGVRSDGSSSRRNFSKMRSISALGISGPSSSMEINTLPRSS